ncbi:DUF4082 domain-containing protein [Actinokineospora diospyrosa]|uniref:DUF4082 domain-containing protein n=1 Tax=Actinokineospora diospyrosa TaxID=103728 RepID=A0ABT1IHJ9_9PSEU|nr:DUF4082 domain-containing protein [Actinokineospora diospyrosa]MCP2272031.1 protein of unknown function (DUF4082) [Actinokineospora diospyrosa]
MFRRLVALIAVVLLVPLTASAAVPPDRVLSWIDSPGPDNVLPLGSPVLLAGTARHSVWSGAPEQPITAVDLSFDGGQTWVGAVVGKRYSATTWSLIHTFTSPGPVTVLSRASTATEVQAAPLEQAHYWVGSGPLPALPCTECSLRLPTRADVSYVDIDPDPRPVELGVRFEVDRAGHIQSIWGGNNYSEGEGTRTARLWNTDGELLGEAPEGSPRTSEFVFDPPVAVEPGKTYVASYVVPWGHYPVVEGYFTASVVQSPFIINENAGVYRYTDEGSEGVPTQTYRGSSYSVVPVFTS